MRLIVSIVIVAAILLALQLPARGQIVAGAGVTYALPQNKFADVNKGSLGGTAALFSRRYCNLWFGLRLDYTSFQEKDSIVKSYSDAFAFSGEARYFFSPPTELPLYLQADITVSGIDGKDSANTSGFGGAIGAGALLFYDKHCCDWFIDLNARYNAPNIFLRSDIRPVLPYFHFAASIYFKL
ncbi:hypothetical protein MASR2M18_09690 [Ignavibacteria bacterium]|nr:outer membrane beta-barrel protein [Bacteroidota bacterium]MCZ2131717.1 hypothetical protein [Bacteroidota bacterium]